MPSLCFGLYCQSRQVLADDEDIPPYESLINMSTLCHNINVETGSMTSITLDHFVRSGVFCTHSLIVMGRPWIGKTPMCRSVCAVIARALAEDAGEPKPFFIHTARIDAVRKVEAWVSASVPILLDDFSAQRMPPDALKHLLALDTAEVLEARYNDVLLAPFQPRVLTANADEPHKWHKCLPPGLLSMEPAARAEALNANANAAAICKRVFFCVADKHFIPEEARKRRVAAVQRQAAEKMARILPPRT